MRCEARPDDHVEQHTCDIDSYFGLTDRMQQAEDQAERTDGALNRAIVRLTAAMADLGDYNRDHVYPILI